MPNTSLAQPRTDEERELLHAATSAMRLLQDRQQHTTEEHLDPRERRVLRQLRGALRGEVLSGGYQGPRSQPVEDPMHHRLVWVPVVLVAMFTALAVALLIGALL
jgi:hypothetical protein